ncbi:Enterobactin synthase component E [compost metagenome]
MALVVCHDGVQLDQPALARHLQPYVDSGHLAKWAIPRQVRCVDEIPKTSVGKIDKKRIRQTAI